MLDGVRVLGAVCSGMNMAIVMTSHGARMEKKESELEICLITARHTRSVAATTISWLA
jgi:hypothetical protein